MKEKIKERIIAARWIAKRHLNALSPIEEQELEKWLARDKKNQEIYERLLSEDIPSSLSLPEREKKWEEFIKKYHISKRSGIRRNIVWLSAACSLLFLLIGSLFLIHPEKKNILSPSPANSVQLVLENGESITIGENKISENPFISERRIKTDSNSIDYSHARAGKRPTMEYHTIIVPKYGEYTIRLSDNTLVKLNSESTLRYPVSFQGETREIWLTGEAYFEVTHDSTHHFTVHAGETKVTVLGTVFNVSDKKDKQENITTLISGKVEIDNGQQRQIIHPGQQAITRPDNPHVDVQQADIATVLAWTRDMFYFNEEPLENIMQELSLWYEFNVIFENEAARDRRFTLETSRYENIDQILRLLEETGVVTCRQEDGTIYIK